MHYNFLVPLKENDHLSITQSKLTINFLFGDAQLCLENLVHESDLNDACDKMQRKRDISQSLKEKHKRCIRINFAQTINHTVSHVVGKYLLEDTLRLFQIKEDEIHA